MYLRATSSRIKEHSKTVLMSMTASGVFLVINGGIIRGLPRIADNFGLFAVAFIVLLVFLATAWAIRRKHHIVSLALMSLILIIVGYSSYTTIFIRSNQNPTIDENDPETTHQAVAYLDREQYGRRSFTDIFNRRVWKPEADAKWKNKSTWNYFWNYQIKKMYIRYFNWQFIGRKGANVDPFQFFLPFPFLIGLYGLMTHFSRDKNKAISVLALFLFTGLMIVLYLNQDDPQPRERDYSYVGSFFAFSIWIGIGATSLISQLTELKSEKLRKPLVYLVTGLLIIALPLNVLTANYHEHDRSGNYVAWDYSWNLLQSCEPNGIIFTNGDNDTFPVWFMQEVEGVRKDVRVVNLSLLNTPWYIKQLKHNEPRIAVGLSDETIDNLQVMPFKKQKVKISPPPGSDLEPMEWEMKPTIMGQGIRVQDLMILQILEANKWERPVYFATTVSPSNRLGMDKYLQMQGLTFRVFPEPVKRTDPEIIKHNLLNVYRYRNLNNPKVHFNDTIVKLIGNYRAAFFQLAIDRYYAGEKEEMVALLDSMEARMPEEILPIGNEDTYIQLGMLYNEGGRPEVLKNRLDRLTKQKGLRDQDIIRYATIYYQYLHDADKALQLAEPVYAKNQNDVELISLMVRLYDESKNYQAAKELLDNWIALHPNDQGAQQMRDKYTALLSDSLGDSSLVPQGSN